MLGAPMAYRVVALPGDGTGPEVMDQALKCLEAVQQVTGVHFDVEKIDCGGQYYLKSGQKSEKSDWPDGSFEKCERADVILLGAVGWPGPDGSPVTMSNGKMAGWSPVIGNRTRLDLYANVRPVKLYPGVQHRVHGRHRQVWEPEKVDMVFVRENTEDLYSGIGGTLRPGGKEKVAIDTRVITREGSERVIRFAYELCRKRERGAPADGKKRLTCILKDNVLEGCRLFGKVFREIGKDYPEIAQETAIVDAFTQWLITKPEWYDVLVTTNMFGDIVTDLASVLQGGMGMAVGANIGDRHAMFEPIHGSAPKYTGQDKVNPFAMILALKEALDWLGTKNKDKKLVDAGRAIEQAVVSILKDGKPLTYDLAGEGQAAKGSEVGSEAAKRLKTFL
ncbi:MAG TPA: isocitrate/isopropylmalate dehydrogenase family protein [Bdellovibrionota bacterium]|nr:isocitrate/isopropylmalate dehydrogenase family protein [Bdellovibrionota bacterium]